MDKIGNQKIWSYLDGYADWRPSANQAIRKGRGHLVSSYFDLAKKVAALQFLNREHVLLFRGQHADHKTAKGASTLKAGLFRLDGARLPTARLLEKRFQLLSLAEGELTKRYQAERFAGIQRLKRHRILRWSILQHYEVCQTPLLDVTHSLRIAASFATRANAGEGFVFVIGVPNISGAVTASSEASIQIVRLSSACPPEAVRPHLQEGYLLGEYPEISDYEQGARYKYYEMDFGRRLVAKFRLDSGSLWSRNFRPAPEEALYPQSHRDRLLAVTEDIKAQLRTLTAGH
jgi:hypothetical protein